MQSRISIRGCPYSLACQDICPAEKSRAAGKKNNRGRFSTSQPALHAQAYLRDIVDLTLHVLLPIDNNSRMASNLASQLAQIAVNSTNALNLKAQKVAHSKSLIFEPRVAASQSFDTLYTLCHEGFEELCLLDGRFAEFQRTIFSEQSQDEDRTVMTAEQNLELDKRLEAFLGLVGSRLRLNPAIKAVEWLVRRFRLV